MVSLWFQLENKLIIFKRQAKFGDDLQKDTIQLVSVVLLVMFHVPSVFNS